MWIEVEKHGNVFSSSKSLHPLSYIYLRSKSFVSGTLVPAEHMIAKKVDPIPVFTEFVCFHGAVAYTCGQASLTL